MLSLWNWILFCRKGGLLHGYSLSPRHSEWHTSPGSSLTFLATPQFNFQAHISLIGWVREGRLAFFFIIIFSLPPNIIQDHSSHCHVNNDYSQLFIPSSELHSIPPKVSAISPLWIWQKYLKFNIKDKNSWSNSNLVQFQHYLPRWKLHNMANCARWKMWTRFKDFFFYRCQLCIHSITKYCWPIFLNISLSHSHSPSLLPPYTQMPSILMWPN